MTGLFVSQQEERKTNNLRIYDGSQGLIASNDNVL